jgi:hypothetical protein
VLDGVAIGDIMLREDASPSAAAVIVDSKSGLANVRFLHTKYRPTSNKLQRQQRKRTVVT